MRSIYGANSSKNAFSRCGEQTWARNTFVSGKTIWPLGNCLWSMAPLKGRHEPGVEAHSLHFSIPQETSSLRYLSRMTEEDGWDACHEYGGPGRTFNDLPSSSFLEEFSLCKYCILSISFANGDFNHGCGCQGVITIRCTDAISSEDSRLKCVKVGHVVITHVTAKPRELPAGNNAATLAASHPRTLRKIFQRF